MVSTPASARSDPLGGSRVRRSRRSAAYYIVHAVAVAAAAVGVYLLAPAPAPAIVFASVAVVSTIVALAGVRRHAAADPYAWRCLLAAASLFLVGLSSRHVRADLPSALRLAPEIAMLIGYALLVLGIVGWSARGTRARRIPTVIDALLVTLSMTFVSWTVFVAPVLSTADDVPMLVINGLFPAVDAGLLTMAFFLLLAKRRVNVCLMLLVIALLAVLVGDLGYATVLGNGTDAGSTVGETVPTEAFDALYLVAFVLLGAAAWHRSMAWVGRGGEVSATMTRRRMSVSVALVATCAVLPLVGRDITTADLVVRSVFLAVILVGMFVRGEYALSGARRSEDRARFDASHDALTGLPDRSMLPQILFGAESSQGRSATVMFADLDNFKIVNDSFGHRAGDELITAAASRITALLRADEAVLRYAGDEFVLVTHAGHARAESLAQEMLDAFAEPFELSMSTVYVSVSIGIAAASGRGGTDDVVSEADTAMYHAKSLGPATYAFFDESLRTAAVRSLELSSALRGAIRRGEMTVHYQPMLSMRTHNVLVYEALVRWRYRGDWIGPDEFIPLAESSNMISEIGRWVLDTALGDLVRLHASGVPTMSMSVNISVLQLRDERFPDVVADLLASHGLPGSVLGLEVTESALIVDPVVAHRVLDRLADQGVVLVLDDFGMGYSSLGRLRDLPITALKIDKSFIDRLPGDEASVSIVSAIVAMSEALGMRTVAEGVETAEQERAVTALGCTYAQGYRYGRPAPIETFLSVPHLSAATGDSVGAPEPN